jgi:hypothetical protein
LADFVNVNLIYNGDHYTVDVDSAVDYDELLDGLVKLLAEQGKLDAHRKYEMVLRGALRLEDGATLEVMPRSGSTRTRNLRPA